MKKSFICIALLLLGISLYAQFNVSCGFDAGYSSSTTEIALPQNNDDEINILYSGIGFDLSYAIPNRVSFGLRGQFLQGLLNCERSRTQRHALKT